MAAGTDCSRAHCGLQADGSYPHYVIGTIHGVASVRESGAIFRKVRQQGYWKSLPASSAAFTRNVLPVSIMTRTPTGTVPVTMLMSQTEFKGAPLKQGDLVRYTPHDESHRYPPAEDKDIHPYWDAIGCVAILCRAEDKACKKQYQLGVFRRDNGVAVDLKGRVLKDVAAIDPVSLFPKTTSTPTKKP